MSPLSASRHVSTFDAQHGLCAIIVFDSVDEHDAVIGTLPDAERFRASALPTPRRRELVAGRAALRIALAEVADAETALVAITSDDRGAPVLPAGWVGSISHKGARAAAIVARDAGARIGIDLELAAPPRLDIGPRVLTAHEHASLAPLGPDAYGRAVTLRFAIKEAIYKAIDPFVRRYVGFTEVELDVRDDGSCAVTVLDRGRLPMAIAATWREVDGYWLATASATPLDKGDKSDTVPTRGLESLNNE